jgi:hypothetical protein
LITVIDAIMGSGKTTYMTHLMNKLHTEAIGHSFADPSHQAPRFLCVTPILTEVERVKKACPDLDFRDPKPIKGKKLNHLSELISGGANICTTHALFRMLNKEVYAKLTDQNYTLVIDEVLDCVEPYKRLSLSDRTMLFNTNKLYVEPVTNRLRWNHNEGVYSGKFEELRNLCDNGNLILFNNTVLWEFPADFLHCFKHVYILTYLFNGSPMSAHLRANGLSYELMTLTSDGQLVSQEDDKSKAETKAKERLSKLIAVYDGSANASGEPKGKEYPFSSGWYERQKPEDFTKLKANLENWFKKVAKTPSRHNAWTAFTKGKTALKGERYAKGFIPCNAKGTNDHIERRSLAYLCNVFYNPVIKAYFQDRGIEVDEGTYALSEMIQWVWRSQIRRYDPITVFIPSERMRSLFLDWLDTPCVIRTELACKDHMQGKVQSKPQTDVLHPPETNGRRLSLSEALRRHEQEQVH